MKRFKIDLSLIAVVIGLSSAFAFSAPAKKQFTNYWFDTTATGVPTTYDSAGPQCLETTGDYCAKQYSATQLNFSGGIPVSVKTGQENNQIASEHRGE